VKNVRRLFIGFYENLYTFILFYALFAPFLSLFAWGAYGQWKDVLLLAAYVAQFFTRKYIKDFFLFLIIHLLILGLVISASTLGFEMLLYGAFTLALTIASYYRHFKPLKRKGLYDIVGLELIFTVMYFVCDYFKLAHMQRLLFAAAVAMLALYFIYTQFINIIKALENAQTVYAQIILKKNNSLILIFTVGLLLLLTLSPFIPVKQFFNVLGAGIISLLKWFFGLFPASEQTETTATTAGADDGNAFYDYIQSQAQPPDMSTAANIVLYAVIGFACVAFFFALCVGAVTFYKRFREMQLFRAAKDNPNKNTNDTRIYVFSNPILNLADKVADMFDQSLEQRIRKVVYKFIKNKKMDTSGKAKTIREIMNGENMSELSAIYEKARYSEQCAQSDLKRAKELVKILAD